MRVVPLENEDVNECWIADRDRFCYEALERRAAADAADDQAGRRVAQRRLDHRARLRGRRDPAREGRVRRRQRSVRSAARIRPSRSCTCWRALVRGLGSENIDHRTRHADFANRAAPGQRALARHADRVAVDAGARARRRLVPAQGPSAVRAAAAPGGAARCADSQPARGARRLADADVATRLTAAPMAWVQALADVASAVATAKGVPAPAAGMATEAAQAIAASLLSRRTQGGAARQRRRAAPAGRGVARAGAMDRRAHRRQRRLPRRGRRTRSARSSSARCRARAG